jgi:hypothetical protein
LLSLNVRAESEAGCRDLELGNHLSICGWRKTRKPRVEMTALERFLITDKDLFKDSFRSEVLLHDV